MYVRLKIFNSPHIQDTPLGSEKIFRLSELSPGDLVAFRDWDTLIARPWRVMTVQKMEGEGEGTSVRLRDALADPDPLSGQGDEISLGFGRQKEDEPPRESGQVYGLGISKIRDYDWPVGQLTGEMLPTARVLWEEVDAAVARERDCFSMEGVCPACGEVVTQRQHSTTFDTNLVVEGGPPVTFHVRKDCWTIGGRYQTKIREIDRDISASIEELEDWSFDL